MTFLARRPVEFNRDGNPRGHTGNHPKEKAQPNCISETKYDRVRDRSGEQSQRPVFAAQQIVSKVQRTEHVEARRRDADAGQQVMIDGVREKHAMIVEGKAQPVQNFTVNFPCVSVFSAML